MTVWDDFRQWERELRELHEEPGAGGPPIATLILFPLACASVIALGATALGVCSFVICVVILVLWRSGM